jgi:dihydroflavonol-4-reductase
MKCVVTGATGHIGNILVRSLHDRGDEVTAFVLPREDISSIKDHVDHVAYGDIRDLQSLHYAFEGKDLVFHLAGIIDIGSGRKMRRLMYEVNVEGVRNVVQACRESGIKRLVYTSSVHAITELPHGQTIAESKVFNPAAVRGPYAKTKAEATALVLKAATDGLDAVVVHPAGIIGPEDHQLSNLGQLMLDFLKGKLLAYVSGGYNFVDVRDVVNGILNAADKGQSGECYILSGEYHSVRDMLAVMEDITKIKAPRTKLPRWFAYITSPFAELHYRIKRQKPLFTAYSIFTLGTNSDYSNEKAKRTLGYTVTPFRKTLEDTIAWIKGNKLDDHKRTKRPAHRKGNHRGNGSEGFANGTS